MFMALLVHGKELTGGEWPRAEIPAGIFVPTGYDPEFAHNADGINLVPIPVGWPYPDYDDRSRDPDTFEIRDAPEGGNLLCEGRLSHRPRLHPYTIPHFSRGALTVPRDMAKPPPRLAVDALHPWFNAYWTKRTRVKLNGEHLQLVTVVDAVEGWAEALVLRRGDDGVKRFVPERVEGAITLEPME